ncbi:hypothetical protein C8R41DRAFT_919675 [Lentinula lateritia]|uniref:Uncharacterized protein n=1 Tax=Lentinula lateritia TaxID=40482 RepID=A0ABQ8VG22_9AGAR|nr:hypothetical protein C8R41DRAFT_919675 [Lentinula lateritia]
MPKRKEAPSSESSGQEEESNSSNSDSDIPSARKPSAYSSLKALALRNLALGSGKGQSSLRSAAEAESNSGYKNQKNRSSSSGSSSASHVPTKKRKPSSSKRAVTPATKPSKTKSAKEQKMSVLGKTEDALHFGAIAIIPEPITNPSTDKLGPIPYLDLSSPEDAGMFDDMRLRKLRTHKTAVIDRIDGFYVQRSWTHSELMDYVTKLLPIPMRYLSLSGRWVNPFYDRKDPDSNPEFFGPLTLCIISRARVSSVTEDLASWPNGEYVYQLSMSPRRNTWRDNVLIFAPRVSLADPMVKWARNENPIPAPRPLSDDENFPSAITSINEEGRYGKSGVKEAEAIQAKRRRPIRTYKGKGKARAASSSSAGELSDSENRGADSDEYPGMKEAISESLATTRSQSTFIQQASQSASTSQAPAFVYVNDLDDSMNIQETITASLEPTTPPVHVPTSPSIMNLSFVNDTIDSNAFTAAFNDFGF